MRLICRAALWAQLLWISSAASADVESLYRYFHEPPKTDSLMPYWFWNGQLSAAETRRQIRAMIRQGVHQAVVFPWDGMAQPYLSEAYWEQVGAALDIAKRNNFTLNFADEFDWPSGHAWVYPAAGAEASRVLQAHPELRMRRLAYMEEIVQGPQAWSDPGSQSPEIVVAAKLDASGRLEADSCTPIAVEGDSARWAVPEGRWVITSYRLVPAVGAHNTRLDLLNPEAARYYLQTVYEEYARRFPQHLGKTLRLTVADHEGAYGAPIAFTPRLWEAFQARHGYDLRRVLPLLVRPTTDDRAARRVRQHYFEVIADLYIRSFNQQVTDWCSRHGLQHATSLYEEQLWFQVNLGGDMFGQWRAGSAVFMDALLERARMPIDFKETASVAHFDRKPLLVENQGLQGHDSFFSLEKARLGSNMCLLWGANRLIPYFDYEPRRIQWPPQWFLGQPLFREFHHYARLVNRAQAMNGRGHHIAPVLIYYPLETAFAHGETLLTNSPPAGFAWHNAMDQAQNFYTALQLELTRAGWDYHVADRVYLQRAKIQDATLRLADESFRVLILPCLTDMDPAAQEQVRRFLRSGGQVLAIGRLPRGLEADGIRTFSAQEHPPFMDRLNYRDYLEVPAGIRADLQPLLNALRAVQAPQVAVVDGSADRLYFSHRQEEGIDWYWVANDLGQARKVTLRFPAAGTYEQWDAETGTRRTLSSRATAQGTEVPLGLEPYEAFFLVRHNEAPRAPVRPINQPEETLLTLSPENWKFTPETGELAVPYAQVGANAEPAWLAPEALSNPDWWVVGPFPYDDHEGFFRAYPPENGFQPGVGYPGATGEVKWQWCHSPTYTVTFRDVLKPGGAFGVYYAYAEIWSPQARRANLRVAFADSLSAWWNGAQVFSRHRHTKWVLLRDCWAESIPVELKSGWNSVLLKIEPSLEGATGFMFRMTDQRGATLRDLVYAKDRSQPNPASRPARLRLTVAVPPGATSLRVPAFREPFGLFLNERPVSAGPGSRVRLGGAQTCRWEVSANDVPEEPIRFGSGTVPFRLQCWTDSALAHFSGSALYQTDFVLPEAAPGKSLLLDLGEVGLAAEVWVNGKALGSRAWRPYRFDLSSVAHRGKNTLRIRVSNSNAGWLAQGNTLYAKGSWGLKFNTERDRLKEIHPNGLEGPVRILRVSQAP